uniref:Pecanex-like protein n=1 Tax=Angiostrongylus cantonensis TaxID=6313 RepID=A0A158P7V6_ANGCA
LLFVDFVRMCKQGIHTTKCISNLHVSKIRRYFCSKPHLEITCVVKVFDVFQIIEMVSPTRDSYGTPTRCRKRPTPSNSIVFKDHLKNLVYNSTCLRLHVSRRHLLGSLVLDDLLYYIAEYVIRSLNEFGWAVVDNFLGDSHCRFTHKEVRCLYQRGLFSAGQLMDDKNKDEYHVKDIRSDQIYWFDGVDPRASDAVTIRLLVSMIDSVVQHFKGRLPPYDISGRSRVKRFMTYWIST